MWRRFRGPTLMVCTAWIFVSAIGCSMTASPPSRIPTSSSAPGPSTYPSLPLKGQISIGALALYLSDKLARPIGAEEPAAIVNLSTPHLTLDDLAAQGWALHRDRLVRLRRASDLPAPWVEIVATDARADFTLRPLTIGAGAAATIYAARVGPNPVPLARVESRTYESAVISDQGTRLPTTRQAIEAGTRVSLTAAYTAQPGEWRINGTLEISSFLGTETDRRATTLTIDVTATERWQLLATLASADVAATLDPALRALGAQGGAVAIWIRAH